MNETGQAEKEFEKWFRQQDPEPIIDSVQHEYTLTEERLKHEWIIRFFSAKLGYLEAHSRQQEKIDGLREGIRDFLAYGPIFPKDMGDKLQKLLEEGKDVE